jgi:hypothetical protein
VWRWRIRVSEAGPGEAVGLGGEAAEAGLRENRRPLRARKPAQLLRLRGGAAEPGPGRGHEGEPEVVVLVGGFGAPCRDRVDVEVEDAPREPGVEQLEAGEPRLLLGLAGGHSREAGIAVRVTADLEPPAELPVMREEEGVAPGVEDPGRSGEVARQAAAVQTVRMILHEAADPQDRGGLSRVAAAVGLEDQEQLVPAQGCTPGPSAARAQSHLASPEGPPLGSPGASLPTRPEPLPMARIPFARGIVIAFLLAAAIPAQVVCIEDPNPALGTSNTIPFGQANGYTFMSVYTAAQLRAGGVCAGALLTDLAVAPSSGTSGTYMAPQAQVRIGHMAVHPPVVGQWTNNFSNSVVVHDLTSGPYSFPWTLNTWTSLPGVGAAGFVWDGVSNVGFYFTVAPGTTGTFSARRTATNIRHFTSSFMAPIGTASSDFAATKVCMTFVGGQPEYMVNQPAAYLDVGGVLGGACIRAEPKICLGATGMANFASTNTGLGWELGYTLNDPMLPVGQGGVQLGSGQIINLNLASPTLGFLNGLLLPPFPGNFSIPLSSSAPLLVTAQMLVLNPGSPEGIALSQASDLEFAASVTRTYPLANDAFVAVPFSTLPCLTASSFDFYGTGHTQMFVGSNGRLMFGPAGSTSATPTVANAQINPGTVGAWCNFDPNLAGSVTVSSSVTNLVRFQYTNVPYSSQAGTSSTFAVELDLSSGIILFDGLLGIGSQTGTLNMFLGVSRGATATIPAVPTSFAAPSGSTGNATDMIYEFGLAGTLGSGRNTILFIPNTFGNYDWL